MLSSEQIAEKIGIDAYLIKEIRDLSFREKEFNYNGSIDTLCQDYDNASGLVSFLNFMNQKGTTFNKVYIDGRVSAHMQHDDNNMSTGEQEDMVITKDEDNYFYFTNSKTGAELRCRPGKIKMHGIPSKELGSLQVYVKNNPSFTLHIKKGAKIYGVECITLKEFWKDIGDSIGISIERTKTNTLSHEYYGGTDKESGAEIHMNYQNHGSKPFVELLVEFQKPVKFTKLDKLTGEKMEFVFPSCMAQAYKEKRIVKDHYYVYTSFNKDQIISDINKLLSSAQTQN